MKKIFIACPISKYLNGDEFTDEYFKTFMENVYSLCIEYTPNVFLALEREKYGKNLMTDICTVLDIEEMKSSDFVIAIPDDSMGVAVELGWASVLKKQILLILNDHQRYTPLISGMGDITNTTIIHYDRILDETIFFKIKEFLDHLNMKK